MGRRTAEVARSSDELRKTQIRTATQRARKALESGILAALRTHGIFENGKCVPSGDLPDHWMAASDRPALDAAIARWERQSQTPAEAVARFAREACYTWLNRLAAVRMLESRRLIAKPIARLDPKSNLPAIVQQVAELSPVLLRASEIAEAALWQSVFTELASSIGALFDPNDPHGRIFPGSAAIAKALLAFGELDDSVWREDDTLGWLYQFFTTKDERAMLREKKGASFTVDDLAVISQFYTPNWVVRFLVDNTIGTLWRRMHPDSKITEFCALLLPPDETEPPYESRRVRELRILDPACGAMHFGVYAFDVLRWMYQEEGLERDADIPRLIVEKNLLGIDIDRRAIQISALNLYMKAAEALREMGEDLPRNLCFGLGCADAPKPSETAVKRLQAGIDDPELQQAFVATIASLDNLHAAGSLFDVEADVCVDLSNRCAKSKVKIADNGLALPGLLTQLAGEASGGTRIEMLATWARMLAERAFRVDDVTEGLAAEDALLGARVLQLICQRYDVVLMNPPYSKLLPPATKAYLTRRYPKSKSNLYGAFFEFAFRVVREGGMVGALTSKTYLYLDSFRHVRSHLLETGMLTSLIDAGHDVLFESTVDTAAMTAIAAPPLKNARATILRVIRVADREAIVPEIIRSLHYDRNFQHDVLYRANLADLRKLPTQTLAYWAPPAILHAYATYPPLEPTYGEVRQGLATGDDERFLRYWWEVPEECIGQGKRWVSFAKGGDYSPYYESLLRVINWKNDGKEVISFAGSVLRNQRYYFREGITFPQIADRFHARTMASGCIFGHMGPMIFSEISKALNGYLNTRVVQALLMAQSAAVAFEVGQVSRLCVPPLDPMLWDKLAQISDEAVARARKYAQGDELDRNFQASWTERIGEHREPRSPLSACIKKCVDQRVMFLNKRAMSMDAASDMVATAMEFTVNDLDEITRTFGSDISADDNARIRGQRSQKRIDPLSDPAEHARRFISGLIKNLMTNCHIITLEQVKAAIEVDITKRFAAGAIDELASYLKKPLQGWVCDDYAKYHLALYRKHPRILRLATKSEKFIVFVDALRVRGDDLRRFRLDVIEPAERAAKAVLAGGATLAKRRAVEDQLEDLQTFTSFFVSILIDWKDDVDDIRPRVEIFRTLASYLTRKK